MARTIKIGVGYDENVAFFHMNVMTIAEENELIADLTAIEDLPAKSRPAKELEICLEAIKRHAIKPPTNKDGEPFFEDKDVVSSIDEFFDPDDSDSARLAISLLLAYRRSLQPKVVF